MEWNAPDRRRKLVTYGKSGARRVQALGRSRSLFSSSHGSEEPAQSPPPSLPKAKSTSSDDPRNIRTSTENHDMVKSPKRRKTAAGEPGTRELPVRRVHSARQRQLARQLESSNAPDVAVATESEPCAFEVVIPLQGRRISRTEELTSSRPSTPERVPDVPILHREPSSQRKRLIDLLGDDDVDGKDSVDDDRQHQPSSSDVESASSPSTVRGPDLGRPEQKVPQVKGEMSQTFASPRSALRVTYARQRSFLSSDLDGPESLTAESINRRLDFAAERPKLVLDTEEDELNTGTVRSIHELRRAGANARFQGIVDSIFEDIEDSTTASARRSALLHLCEKLIEKDFAPRFIQTNGVDRLANCITERLDDMAAYLALCAYILVLGYQPLPTSVFAIFWPKIVRVMPSLLTLDADIAKLVPQRRFGLSKVNQAAVREVSVRVGESQPLAEQESGKISPQRVVLRAVQLTVQKVTERDIVAAFPDSAVSQLVSLLLKHSAHVTDLEPSSYDMVILDSVFSILEAITTVSRALGRQHQQALKPLSETSHLLSSLGQANEEPFAHLLVLLLKVILNVTNNNSYLCDDFATPELIQALTNIVLSNFRISSGKFIEETNHTLDIVILCLGGLINLTEESERARQVILHHKDDSRTLLEKLLDLFSTGLDSISEAHSVVQTHSNVAFGYLSILLCTVSLDPEVRAFTANSLEGHGLTKILATVDEFLHYHRKVDEELQQSQAMTEFTTRLQGIVDQIRAT